jgi:hypothetical protein
MKIALKSLLKPSTGMKRAFATFPYFKNRLVMMMVCLHSCRHFGKRTDFLSNLKHCIP